MVPPGATGHKSKFRTLEVCSGVPQGVTQSGIFVLDFDKVEEKDLTTDGNRTYERQ